MIDLANLASIPVSSTRNDTLHTPFRAQHHSTRDLAAATAPAENLQPLPAHSHQTIPLGGRCGGKSSYQPHSFRSIDTGNLSRREGARVTSGRFHLAADARRSTRKICTRLGRRHGSACCRGENKRCEWSYVGEYSAFAATSRVMRGSGL